MAGMERFRGHFYNWYDTTTLQPLRPTYVSTVDSGNLAGHLVVLRMALLEIAERPLLERRRCSTGSPTRCASRSRTCWPLGVAVRPAGTRWPRCGRRSRRCSAASASTRRPRTSASGCLARGACAR